MHLVRQFHHHPDVVLDDKQRHTEFGVDPAKVVDQSRDGRRIDAGRRLIEQQHLGLAHQSHSHFEQLALTIGQLPSQQVPLGLQPDESQQFQSPLPAGPARARKQRAQTGAGMRDADQQTLQTGHLPKNG